MRAEDEDVGHVLTSAGTAAWIDFCLHVVQNDYGAADLERAADLKALRLQPELRIEAGRQAWGAPDVGPDPLDRLAN
jgi:transcriptional regulator GlxA family with amidase domain